MSVCEVSQAFDALASEERLAFFEHVAMIVQVIRFVEKSWWLTSIEHDAMMKRCGRQ